MESCWLERFDLSVYNAVCVEQLRGLRERMHAELRPSLFPDAVGWNKGINGAHDRLIAGTIALAEQTLRLERLGVPPVPYAFLAVGSAGRMEQTLWSDQDNALVYAEPPPDKAEKAANYFRLLAERTYAWLQSAGYPPCPGNVLCANPLWRKTLPGWNAVMRQWLDEPQWEHVRCLLMIADMRCLYGDVDLAGRLRSAYMGLLAERPAILVHMLQNTLFHKISLGVFGNMITERYGEDAGTFDIKYGAYIPLVNGIRLLALACGLPASSTLERLDGLAEAGKHPVPDINRWREAFKAALEFRSLAQYEEDGDLYRTRGMIKPDVLSKGDRRRLKQCLRAGIELQQEVRKTVERIAGGAAKKRGGLA